MARFGTHATAGILIGAGIAAIDSHRESGKIDVEVLLAAIAGGFLGGILPDVFEPATNPDHRSFFHAIAPTAAAVLKADFVGIEDLRVRAFLKGLLWGYVGHLILDFAGGGTGLPLVH